MRIVYFICMMMMIALPAVHDHAGLSDVVCWTYQLQSSPLRILVPIPGMPAASRYIPGYTGISAGMMMMNTSRYIPGIGNAIIIIIPGYIKM